METRTVAFVRFTESGGHRTDWYQLPAESGDSFFVSFGGADRNYHFESEAYHLGDWAARNGVEVERHEVTVELPAGESP